MKMLQNMAIIGLLAGSVLLRGMSPEECQRQIRQCEKRIATLEADLNEEGALAHYDTGWQERLKTERAKLQALKIAQRPPEELRIIEVPRDYMTPTDQARRVQHNAQQEKIANALMLQALKIALRPPEELRIIELKKEKSAVLERLARIRYISYSMSGVPRDYITPTDQARRVQHNAQQEKVANGLRADLQHINDTIEILQDTIERLQQ